MDKISVLVVDDSLTIRAMIERILEDQKDISIIGPACDADEAMLLVERNHPHVITLDIAMPGMDGLSFLTEIMSRHPLPVIMVSSQTSAGAPVREEALRLGAVACFNKADIISDCQSFVKLIRVAFKNRKKIFLNKTPVTT